jgi:hypothetical protein
MSYDAGGVEMNAARIFLTKTDDLDYMRVVKFVDMKFWTVGFQLPPGKASWLKQSYDHQIHHS